MTPNKPPNAEQMGVRHFLVDKTIGFRDFALMKMDVFENSLDFLLDLGSLYLNEERVIEVPEELKTGDYLRIHQRPRRFNTNLLKPDSAIVFNCNDFLVVNKPSGLPVHPTVDNRKENLLHTLGSFLQTDLFVTHRLDVPTSGLIVLAKTKAFQKYFNDLLVQRKVSKLYRTLVHGIYGGPDEVIHYMEPSLKAPKRLSAVPMANYQVCKLRILDINPVSEKHSELSIELLTGRTHQIRAQMSFNGNPVVGDIMYGSRMKLAEHEEICLQASFLAFPLESGEEFRAKLPSVPWVNPT